MGPPRCSSGVAAGQDLAVRWSGTSPPVIAAQPRSQADSHLVRSASWSKRCPPTFPSCSEQAVQGLGEAVPGNHRSPASLFHDFVHVFIHVMFLWLRWLRYGYILVARNLAVWGCYVVTLRYTPT